MLRLNSKLDAVAAHVGIQCAQRHHASHLSASTLDTSVSSAHYKLDAIMRCIGALWSEGRTLTAIPATESALPPAVTLRAPYLDVGKAVSPAVSARGTTGMVSPPLSVRGTPPPLSPPLSARGTRSAQHSLHSASTGSNSSSASQSSPKRKPRKAGSRQVFHAPFPHCSHGEVPRLHTALAAAPLELAWRRRVERRATGFYSRLYDFMIRVTLACPVSHSSRKPSSMQPH